MSRSLSSSMLQALYSAETGDAFLVLLTITHADLATSLRFTSDEVNTVSGGNTFIPFPFDLTLPSDTDTAPPRARLSIDNVDREIVLAIRSVSTSPIVQIDIVRAAAPDTIEATFVDFKMTNIVYSDLVVTCDLTVEDFTSEPFPSATFSPSLFPGIF